MPQSSQMPDLVLEEKPGALENKPKPGTSVSGLVGLGIIALCGLCCSLPLVAGSGLAISVAAALAFLSVAWPVVLGIIGLTILISGAIVVRRTGRRANPGNSPTSFSEMAACSACNVDGSCGCQN
jgi:hypothetical protein